MNTLIVNNLNKSFSESIFSKKQVLNNVSISIREGSTVGFIGSNGSGKTTTIKCLLGFIFPDESSEILFFDHKKFTAEVRLRIGYLPERPYLPEYLTAKEFLKFHWDLTGAGAGFAEACTFVLGKVDLAGVEGRRLRTFSKGMLQRMGLAQALLRNPDFLILDEPMSGLDPDGRMIVKDIIRQEHARGATIFFSSHLLSDMDELCSDLIVIDKGNIEFQGPLSEFVKSDLQSYSVEAAFARFRQERNKNIKNQPKANT